MMTLINLSLRPDALTRLEKYKAHHNRFISFMRGKFPSSTASDNWNSWKPLKLKQLKHWYFFKPTGYLGIYEIGSDKPWRFSLHKNGFYNQSCTGAYLERCIADNAEQIHEWFESIKDQYDGHGVISMCAVPRHTWTKNDQWWNYIDTMDRNDIGNNVMYVVYLMQVR